MPSQVAERAMPQVGPAGVRGAPSPGRAGNAQQQLRAPSGPHSGAGQCAAAPTGARWSGRRHRIGMRWPVAQCRAGCVEACRALRAA